MVLGDMHKLLVLCALASIIYWGTEKLCHGLGLFTSMQGWQCKAGRAELAET